MPSAYQAARQAAALLDRSSRGRILVNGRDRASYLQGLLTNDIEALRPGGGCYAAYLTAQGRMIADLWVYELGDLILLSLAGEVRGTVMARLDQFIFSEDVQLGDVTDTFGQVAVVGPGAAAAVSGLLDDPAGLSLDTLPEHGNLRSRAGGQPVIITRITDTGEPGFDLYAERPQIEQLKDRLMAAGVVALDADTADILRIEAGIPRFGPDMDEHTIPLEAGIESRAISMTKGCYVGQEVIVRVLHRGHGRVARKLVGLVLDGERTPSAGDAVLSGEHPAGDVRSAAKSPTLGRPIALAYVQRDLAAPGTPLAVNGSAAAVAELPFVAR
jgi:folate-binding protein YgfZ